MENLNLAIVSSPKPLLLGHPSPRDATARDVFRRRMPFAFGRVFVSPLSRSSLVTRASLNSHQNPNSGIFISFPTLLRFYKCYLDLAGKLVT